MPEQIKTQIGPRKVLQSFPPESAGKIMSTNIPLIPYTAIMADVKKMFIQRIKELEIINYVYVVNKRKQLKGVVSIKDVFRHPKDTPVSQVIIKDFLSVKAHTDQEKVALIALKENLKAVPVVDKDNHILGAVSSAAILNVLHNESVEDALHFAGIHKIGGSPVSSIKASATVHFRERVPWLLLGLAGVTVAAFVVSFFENALKEQLILAAFIPAVVYMADAIGTQVQTLFVRSIAIDNKLDLKKYIWREVKVNFLLAFLLGIIISIIPLLRWQSSLLGAILGISIFIAMFTAMVVAISISWVLSKMEYDPAIASGPFTTIIQDILSLLIYFSVAQFMLNTF